MVLLLLQYIQ